MSEFEIVLKQVQNYIITFPTFQMSHGAADNILDLIFTSEDSRIFELCRRVGNEIKKCQKKLRKGLNQ